VPTFGSEWAQVVNVWLDARLAWCDTADNAGVVVTLKHKPLRYYPS